MTGPVTPAAWVERGGAGELMREEAVCRGCVRLPEELPSGVRHLSVVQWFALQRVTELPVPAQRCPAVCPVP